jgi:hypothetical protein
VTLLAAVGPARAGTITLAELEAAGGARRFRPASELRLRVAPQSGAAVVQGTQATQTGTQSATAQQQPQQPSGASVPAGGNVTSIGGADATLSQSGGQVETVDLGDVTGSVCDCGEIPREIIPRAGGFPWWALAGIPLICVSGVCFGDEDTPPNSPPPPSNPPPPNNPIPEPATLLLFGTGLLAAGAGARRRRRQTAATADAEEV